MTIPVTTRAGKGSALTPTEMDTNLTNLARDASTTVQGNIRTATEAEARSLTGTTLGISPGTLGNGIDQYYTNIALFSTLASNGIYGIPHGPRFQWGSTAVGNISSSGQDVSVTFPIAFTTLFQVLLTVQDSSGLNPTVLYHVKSTSTSGCVARLIETGGFVQNITLTWFAIGV